MSIKEQKRLLDMLTSRVSQCASGAQEKASKTLSITQCQFCGNCQSRGLMVHTSLWGKPAIHLEASLNCIEKKCVKEETHPGSHVQARGWVSENKKPTLARMYKRGG